MKMMVKVLLTAAAIAALAAPALAADKLIVRNATDTADVFKVDDTGVILGTKVGLGTSNPVTSFHNAESTTLAARGITVAQHNTGAQGASIVFRKSDGSEASPVQPIAGDYIGLFQAQFYDSTSLSYIRSAQFGFRNDGAAVTPGSFPTAIMFYVGDKAVNLKEALRISSSTNVVVGNLGGAAAADLTTAVTDGFLYIPNVAGALTSCATATLVTGHSPVWYDTTNNKICTCRASALKCTATLL